MQELGSLSSLAVKPALTYQSSLELANGSIQYDFGSTSLYVHYPHDEGSTSNTTYFGYPPTCRLPATYEFLRALQRW